MQVNFAIINITFFSKSLGPLNLGRVWKVKYSSQINLTFTCLPSAANFNLRQTEVSLIWNAHSFTGNMVDTGKWNDFACDIKLLVDEHLSYWNQHKYNVVDWKRYFTEEIYHYVYISFNTLRPRQNGRHFADDIFKCIFLNENAWISLEISVKFVPKVQINNIPALVQIMAWRRPGDKPLSEPMVVSLLTHICVTRPHWVKPSHAISCYYPIIATTSTE